MARLGKRRFLKNLGHLLAFAQEHLEAEQVAVDALAVGGERGVLEVAGARLSEQIDPRRVLRKRKTSAG